jgi:hypothetical protein
MVNLKTIAIAAACWSADRIDVFRVGFNSDLQRGNYFSMTTSYGQHDSLSRSNIHTQKTAN